MKAVQGRRSYLIAVAAAAFLVIVLSRQRTASLAIAIGIVTLFVSDLTFLRRHAAVVMIGGMLVVAALAVWATGLLPELIQMLPREFQESLQKTATLTGREEIWSYALGWRFANWDAIRQFFGAPAGEPLDIVTHQGLWKYSLHSPYVATIMNYGILGAFAWISLVLVGMAGALRALRQQTANRAGLSSSVVLAWLAILLVYGITYELQNGAGFFLAMALAGWPARSVVSKVKFRSRLRPRGLQIRGR
jgi:O-antigen ligase